ncbi:50S ribosomal protein L24 [Glaciecola sp. SC05]|uniref:50S ribosomal protein L24 n=1 Tax=Glaciecola sp. SC05 TaxID=1987355 RepID=UPI0035284DE6
MANKIRRDDEVVVLAGKDKGKHGKVTRVVAESNRVYVDGVNVVKKHQKGNPQAGEPGGIIDKEASIHVSNIAIVNSATGKADRVGFRFEDGKKVRFFKSNGDLV